MGNQSSRDPMTHQIARALVDVLTETLDPDECDTVRGDMAEAGPCTFHAVRDVLGLVARRQMNQWAHFRPWMILAGLIVPLAFLLSIFSCRSSGMSSVYLWMYINNWHWGDARTVGFWQVLSETVLSVCLSQLTLVCWAWTAGLAIGAVSRGLLQVNRLLLSFTLLFAELVGIPLYLDFYSRYLHRSFGVPGIPDPNAPVFAIAFYREMFPFIVQAIFVVFPALWGMREGSRATGLRPALRAVVWIVAIAALCSMVIQTPDLWIFLRVPPRALILPAWKMQFLRLAVFWPVVYWAAAFMGRRRHRVTVST
jgi:hypothetical protein